MNRTQHRRRSASHFLTLLVASAGASVGTAFDRHASVLAESTAPVIDGAALLYEAWDTISSNFFDPKFNGVDWPAVLEKYKPQAKKAASRDELAHVVNAMLGELHVSHTSYYTVDDREYYELLDVFNHRGFAEEVQKLLHHEQVRYEGIGIVTQQIGEKTFIKDVIEGLPGEEAGLLVGDGVIAVDGKPFHPIRSWRGKAGETVTLTVQRTADESSRREVKVSPRWIVPHEMFLESIKSGARIVEQVGKRIAYVRIRSYASEDFQNALVELVTGDGKLAGADALVLDIRGGWGGANPEYLELFNRNIPAMTMINRDGERHVFDSRWRKPVVLLIDGGSRSGKEVLAQGFKTRGIGKIVGERTAGAVVGGRPFLLSDGSLLLVAVADVLVDGVRIEARGVEPDVRVECPLQFAEGKDPQLQKAIEVAAEQAQAESPR